MIQLCYNYSMSVSYKTIFRKKQKDGTEKTLTVCFGRQFGEILDELEPIGSRSEKRKTGDYEYDMYINTYDFAEINEIIREEKARRKEYVDGMIDKQRNLYQVSNVKLYEHIREEIASDLSMIEFYDEKLEFIEYIQNGVSFHFLYEENMYETAGIVFDVEVI